MVIALFTPLEVPDWSVSAMQLLHTVANCGALASTGNIKASYEGSAARSEATRGFDEGGPRSDLAAD